MYLPYWFGAASGVVCDGLAVSSAYGFVTGVGAHALITCVAMLGSVPTSILLTTLFLYYGVSAIRHAFHPPTVPKHPSYDGFQATSSLYYLGENVWSLVRGKGLVRPQFSKKDFS